MSFELDAARTHLESLETFLASRAHEGYVAARRAEIKILEDAIIAHEPVDRVSEIEGFKLRGELRSQTEMLSCFEDARDTLKDRINEMVEQENEIATTTKV